METGLIIEIILFIITIIGIGYKIGVLENAIYKEMDGRTDILNNAIKDLGHKLELVTTRLDYKEQLLAKKLEELDQNCKRNDNALKARIQDIEKFLDAPTLDKFNIRSRDRYNLDITGPESTNMQ